MSLAYVVAKLFVNMFIFIYAGGHLGLIIWVPYFLILTWLAKIRNQEFRLYI